MSDSPSPTASSGRGAGGKFGPGNKFSRGNPHAKRVQAIRAAIMRAVKPKDIGDAVKKIVELAKAGDRVALAEILDRTVGRPIPADIEERLARLEELVSGRRQP